MPKKKPNRSDNRYEYKATLGRDFRGKLIRKSFYSTVSLADAKAKAEEYKISAEVSARTGEAFIPSQYDFTSWAKKWLITYKKPFVDANTYALTYESLVNGHLIPYFGQARLTDIRPVDIQNFFATKTQCSESRLKKMKSILNALFEAAIENDLCYKNPAKHSTFRSTAARHEKQVLTDEQIQITKDFARSRMPEVIVLLETGLRRGELLGLMWSDLDEQSGTIRVQRSMALKNKRVVANPPKWNSFRTLPLSDEALRAIRAQPHDSLYIFPNEHGRPHSPYSWSQKLGRFMRDLHTAHPEVPTLTAHELRHTYGTYLRRHGVDIYTIQKLLGHKDIQITTEVYVHNEIDQLRSALRPVYAPEPAQESAE